MKSSLLFNFTIDKENKSIYVDRQFAAPLSRVWDCWTKTELLEQWWAPKPWKAQTKSMNFNEGGYWLYAMVGPEGQKHWSKVSFQSIKEISNFIARATFCDEKGEPQSAGSLWNNSFFEDEPGTTLVKVKISYETLADMEMMIEMGFQGGFSMGLSNLDELLAQQ
jgi:uncharacterized protein YndB with AHSA1/START domain